MLHWLQSGETFQPEITPKHQLIYLMEGKASINLDNKDYEVARGAGVYLARPKPRRFARRTARRRSCFIWWFPRFPVSR